MLTIVYIIVLSLLSGVAYRIGGSSKGNRLFRILGCPLMALVAIWVFLGLNTVPFWVAMLTFGLTAGVVSAYWGLDEKKFGYWAHGIGLSLAVLPIVYVTGHWLGFILRTIVLTGSITLISEFTSIDWLEEGLRGIVIILTLPLLLI